MNDFVSEIENKFDTTTETYDLQNFLNQAGTTKYYETVAFRIEKIGGMSSSGENSYGLEYYTKVRYSDFQH